jgi:hypothetical protein
LVVVELVEQHLVTVAMVVLVLVELFIRLALPWHRELILL